MCMFIWLLLIIASYVVGAALVVWPLNEAFESANAGYRWHGLLGLLVAITAFWGFVDVAVRVSTPIRRCVEMGGGVEMNRVISWILKHWWEIGFAVSVVAAMTGWGLYMWDESMELCPPTRGRGLGVCATHFWLGIGGMIMTVVFALISLKRPP